MEERQAQSFLLISNAKIIPFLRLNPLPTDLFSMHLPLDLFVGLALLLVARCLPIPSVSTMPPLEVISLAYSRRGILPPDDRSSTDEYSPVGRPQVWGGTPSNTSICKSPALWIGTMWWGMGTLACFLIVTYGVLAFVMWGIMTVDLPRLIVWNRTGDEQRRKFAGKVLKVRNRPNWMLLSLLAVSAAIAEALPFFWSHLLEASLKNSYLATNVVILVSQVGPTFVMPVFHLEVSGRFTWLVRCVMWLSAPATVLPAYALRRLKQWRKRGQQAHMDGILPLNELTEFIHLHEKGQGYGGTLDDRVGKMMRNLLEGQISGKAYVETEGPRSSTDVETEGPRSSVDVETEGSRSTQFTESVRPPSVDSRHEESTTAVVTVDTIRPTSIRSHRQEVSTAIEDVPAPGLRKRGERSTEGYESVVSMQVVSVQIPEQALTKNPSHGSPTLVNDM